MSIKTIAAAWLLAASLVAGPALAQAQDAIPMPNRALTAADLKELQTGLRDSRKQVVAQNLTLTPDEAGRFWPIYDQYVAEQTKIKDTQYQLIAEYVNTYGKFDDKAAASFITRWLDLDVKTSALRARYVPMISKVLPGIKAATFFQIDRRINMLMDLKITQLLPIVQEQARLTK